MTVVYINAVHYQTCPNHESDNHFFAKIPGGGGGGPDPRSPPLDPPLLENDFIEPSQSNYSSPCILVPKSNGTYRMCTDYRK